jgi:hypothetical protein
MARGVTDRYLRRRRPQEVHGEDRMSALSDDLLLLILRRLDTRSALRTGLLSKRWSCLPRELPALDFRVADILPPRYHRWIRLYCSAKVTHSQYRLRALTEKLLPKIRRYERRAMRSLTSFVESFLGAANDSGGVGGARRRVRRLRLGFFSTQNTGCINRLIAKAIDAWGVDDLEAVATPIYMDQTTVHTFPIHGLCEKPHASRLRRLKLGGCVLPSLHEHSALTMLILQNIPESTSDAAAYAVVFTTCPQLQMLRLISCHYSGDMVVDAPRSAIRELVVDKCAFARICLRNLPNLKSLASLGTRVFFESPSFPCLRQCNLALCLGVKQEGLRQYFARILKLKLGLFLRRVPDITYLIIRFTGPDRWIIPSSFTSSLLPNMRRLLVADLPSSWDASWPRLLLEMAPSLETFHIHIAPCAEEAGDEIPWQPSSVLRHHQLKEFVMVGFEGTERQLYLVKFVMGSCTALKHVGMFRKGYVRDKGHWDWEIVTQPQPWTDDEKNSTLKKIVDGASYSTTLVQLVFG